VVCQTSHIEYIIAASNLHAYNYGLKGHTDLATHKKVASSVKVPDFTPKANLKIQVNDNEAPPENPRAYLGHELYVFQVPYTRSLLIWIWQVMRKKMLVALHHRFHRHPRCLGID
jgi:hypothetical protein